LGNVREKDKLEDQVVDWRIILPCIFRKWDGGGGMDRVGSGWGQMAGCCECGNGTSGFRK